MYIPQPYKNINWEDLTTSQRGKINYLLKNPETPFFDYLVLKNNPERLQRKREYDRERQRRIREEKKKLKEEKKRIKENESIQTSNESIQISNESIQISNGCIQASKET